MKDANALWHSWMKKYGNGCGFYQREMVNDINALIGEKVSKVQRFWVKEADRLGRKIYKLEKEKRK